jgi:glucose/mannose-6-phosphate isomerase
VIDLDDLPLVSTLDPSNFLGTVERFPDQLRAAYQRAHETEGLPEAQGIDSIVVLGMGGSGISGDVCRVVLGERSPLFIQTLKGYELPTWVGRNTLVFAVSYSGETEETLETFNEAAQRRGARVVIVSTGGTLAARGKELDVPLVFITPGLQPRAAFGYLSIPILVVCERMGIGPQVGPDILEAITLLEKRSSQYGREVSVQWNPAKQLAGRIFGKIPIIYGSEGLAEVAAYRWKCQLNECSKMPAWWHVFPELNHNEIVGWARPTDITRKDVGVIILRHDGEHPRVAKRIEVTIPLIERSLGYLEVVRAEGSSVVARLFDLTYLGDFVATYLALAQGVDPAPVEVIQDLKRQLAVED